MPQENWSPEELELLREVYLTARPKEIATLFPKRSKYAIRNRALRLGLKRERRDGWNRKYEVLNHTCFDQLNDASAYWLGFIWADGHVSRDGYSVCIRLNKRDSGHLLKFLSFIDADYKIYSGKQDAKSVSVANRHIHEALRRYGITHDKSQRTCFPESVMRDETALAAFIRGYFDGDGSLFMGTSRQGKLMFRFNFTGHRDFIIELASILNARFDMKNKPYKDKRSNAWQYIVCNNRAAKEFFDWIYSGNISYCLDRKRELYEKMRSVV